MPSAKSEKRAGFFCELPLSTIAEIKRRAKRDGVAQWDVIDNAVMHAPKLAKKRKGK